jgi:hypothetical protein
MKSYTDLEQSKKLAKILPLESADMCYKCIGDESYDIIVKPYSEYYEKYKLLVISKDFNAVPCWSLAALLSLIPKRIKDYNVLRIDISDNDFAIWYDEIGYGVNVELPDIETKEPIDACYEMIIKLDEQKLL